LIFFERRCTRFFEYFTPRKYKYC